jgi:hypothetical protein
LREREGPFRELKCVLFGFGIGVESIWRRLDEKSEKVVSKLERAVNGFKWGRRRILIF